MKKTMLYAGLGLVAFGACLLCLGWFVDDRLSGVFNGFAGAMAGVGIGNLIRWNRIQKEPDGEYARELRQAQIEEHDERSRMIRERSAYFTMWCTMFLLIVLHFVFRILESLGKCVGFCQGATWLCFGLLLLMFVVYFVAIKVLNHRV